LVSLSKKNLVYGVIILVLLICLPTQFFHADTRHIKIDFYFLREWVANKQHAIKFISCKDQIADGFTMTWCSRKLDEFKRNLNLSRV
jgi:hypothetical protein